MKAFSKWRSGIALLIVVFVACLAGCCLAPADDEGVDVADSLTATRVQPAPAPNQATDDKTTTQMRN